MIARQIALARKVQPSVAARWMPAHYSTTAVARHASPAAEPHHHDSEASSSTASASSSTESSSSPSSTSYLSSRMDKKSRFLPYAYASSSPLTRLPTPLPSDVAERSASLRKYLQQPKKSTSSEIDDFIDEKSLPFGDLAGLTMSSTDQSFFPGSRTVEYIGILKACLGTGLITRAHKLFTDLRNQAAARSKEKRELRHRLAQGIITENDWHHDFGQINKSDSTSLQIWTYNSMLKAYMRKAYQAESLDGTTEWLNRSWELWTDMEQSATASQDELPYLSDPAPNAASFVMMLRGMIALQRSSRYPSDVPTLEHIIQAIRSSKYDFDDILTSSAFNPDSVEDLEVQGPLGSKSIDRSTEGEVDAQIVLHRLLLMATEMGEGDLVRELDTVQSILDGRKTLAELKPDEALRKTSLLDAPELMPVKHKRKGHHADAADTEGQIPFNLISLKDNLSIVQEARTRIEDPYERQKWLEHSALDSARRSLQVSAEKLGSLGIHHQNALSSKPLQTWMWQWYNKLQEVLTADLERLENSAEDASAQPPSTMASNTDQDILPFLRLLPVPKLALITILELMRMSGNSGIADGMKTTRALLQVGRAIETEYQSEIIRKNPSLFSSARAAQMYLRRQGLANFDARKDLRRMSASSEEESIMSQISKWTQVVRARVGSFLVQKLMQVALVHRQAIDKDGITWEEDQPAFYSAYQYVGGKKLGVIKLNEVVAARMDKESLQETLHPRHLPMLVPPKPWTTHDAGGYYSVRQSAMRFKDSSEQGSYLRAASENGDLDTVLAALDVLGNTSWKINKPIFDVMTEVWNSGKSLASIPPPEIDLPEPQRPENYDHDLKARSIYLQRIKQWTNQRNNLHSQRCDVNYKLEIARAFLGERFYFPHNIDFRGRAYPLPPNLNHMGNDLCRGLLTFAEAKPLGAVGLRWMRIHISNVFGYDKASFAEREQFAIDNEAKIRDSAERPLDGERWWLSADDPWQCLAACMELTAALKHPGGPEAFESSLPVHQDGTCNGLQHYAALGGDLAGAKQVNLSQGDRPADVYSGVADLVIEVLNKEAANGVEMAKILQGKVTRKVVKQTVMTTVYGVTFVGAKNQVMRQLADRGDVAAEHLFSAGSYLAKIIMSCIGDLFTGAKSIQDWLSDAAKLIAKSIPPQRLDEAMRPFVAEMTQGTRKKQTCSKLRNALKADYFVKEQMTSVIWTTALGLPVVQPYRKVKKRQVMTSMQTVYIQDPLTNAEVSPTKQSTAFPPNFIHSLDATHMILTALECHAAGLTFASVHDSYWTHASDIETMSDMIRETFIRLHTQDILQRLRDEFLQRYAGYKIPVVSLRYSRQKKMGLDSVHVLHEDEVARLEGETGEVAIQPSQSSHDEDSVDSLDGQTAEVSDADSVASIVRRKAIGEKTKPTDSFRGKAAKAKTKEDWEELYKAKFVDLADILPPIPAKGSFDVNEIKRSLYFFS